MENKEVRVEKLETFGFGIQFFHTLRYRCEIFPGSCVPTLDEICDFLVKFIKISEVGTS